MAGMQSVRASLERQLLRQNAGTPGRQLDRQVVRVV